MKYLHMNQQGRAQGRMPCNNQKGKLQNAIYICSFKLDTHLCVCVVCVSVNTHKMKWTDTHQTVHSDHTQGKDEFGEMKGDFH